MLGAFSLLELPLHAQGTVDNVSPVFVSARTDSAGDKVIITFSEEIHPSPRVSYLTEKYNVEPFRYFIFAFDVSINGKEVHHFGATISGTELTINHEYIVASEDVVRVAHNNIFARTAGGVLADASGNVVPNFSFQTVQNNSDSDGQDNGVEDRSAGAVLSLDEITIAENGSGSYTVALPSQPSVDVTLVMYPLNAEGSVSPYQVTPVDRILRFTPDNWNDPQTVNVSLIQGDEDSADAWAVILHQLHQLHQNPNAFSHWNFVRVLFEDEDTPLEVSGNKSTDYAENGVSPVATYSVADAEDSTISWQLFGHDKSVFSINSAGELNFRAPPNHENPIDSNGGQRVPGDHRSIGRLFHGVLLDVRVTVTREEPSSPLTPR